MYVNIIVVQRMIQNVKFNITMLCTSWTSEKMHILWINKCPTLYSKNIHRMIMLQHIKCHKVNWYYTVGRIAIGCYTFIWSSLCMRCTLFPAPFSPFHSWIEHLKFSYRSASLTMILELIEGIKLMLSFARLTQF